MLSINRLDKEIDKYVLLKNKYGKSYFMFIRCPFCNNLVFIKKDASKYYCHDCNLEYGIMGEV